MRWDKAAVDIALFLPNIKMFYHKEAFFRIQKSGNKFRF